MGDDSEEIRLFNSSGIYVCLFVFSSMALRKKRRKNNLTVKLGV